MLFGLLIGDTLKFLRNDSERFNGLAAALASVGEIKASLRLELKRSPVTVVVSWVFFVVHSSLKTTAAAVVVAVSFVVGSIMSGKLD